MKKLTPILFLTFAFALSASAADYTFTGCGTPEVNGDYTQAGVYNSGTGDIPYFKNANGVVLYFAGDSYWSLSKELNPDGGNRYYRGIWRDSNVSSILSSTEWQVESLGTIPGCTVVGGASNGTTTTTTAAATDNTPTTNTNQTGAAAGAGTPSSTPIIVGTVVLLVIVGAWFGYKKRATGTEEPTV